MRKCEQLEWMWCVATPLRVPVSDSGRSSRVCAYLIAFLLLPALAASQDREQAVGYIDGAPVTHADVWFETERIVPTASYHGNLSAESWGHVVDRALEDAVERKLAAGAARARGLRIPGDKLEQIESAVMARLGSKRALSEWLRARGISLGEFRRLHGERLLAKALQEQITAQILEASPASEPELRRYFQENPAAFIVPSSVDVEHILIRVQPSASAAEWEAGAQRAAEVTERARQGEDFGELVRRYSDDASSRETLGKLSGLHGGRYAATISAAAAGLEPLEIGDPVRSLYGYHVVKLMARRSERPLEFEEVNSEALRAHLRRQAVQGGIATWRRQLRAGVDVEFDSAQVAALRARVGAPARPGRRPAEAE